MQGQTEVANNQAWPDQPLFHLQRPQPITNNTVQSIVGALHATPSLAECSPSSPPSVADMQSQ